MSAIPDHPRALVITRNLPPLRGGMERLNHHLLQELSNGFDTRVCCPRECLDELPSGVAGRGAPLRPLRSFVLRSAVNALVESRKFRPHLVLAGSGLTAPLAQAAAWLSGAKSAAYLHGLDIVVESQAYRRIWRPWFRKLDLILVNSRHTASLAAAAGLDPRRIHVLHPGVELPPEGVGAADRFRQDFGLGGRRLLLSLGRLTARKGLVEFIDTVMPRLVSTFPDVCLVVIGGEAVHALKGGASQLGRIEESIRRLGLQDHVRLLGEQPDEVVHDAFAAATALVFPVREMPGDVEGFGMVAIEAAAHGIATVAFAVGGVVDAVSPSATGYLLLPADYDAMAETLRRLMAGEGAGVTPDNCRAFARDFAWPRFGERLRTLCRQALGA